MRACVAIVLHAHLPFVRHPEHDRFLEEAWLYEAITECYLPLLKVFHGWRRDGIRARVTLTLSPTLCAMLQDDLLRRRYERSLNALIDLAEREVYRTHWEPGLRELAEHYLHAFQDRRATWQAAGGDLVAAFRDLQ